MWSPTGVAFTGFALVLVCGCAPAPVRTAGSEPVTASAADLARACPDQVRSADGVLRRAVVPERGAVLCRYLPRDDRLVLTDVVPVSAPDAVRHEAAYERRDPGTVDCEPQVGEATVAVLDRTEAGEPRVVTVDLALCGTIVARDGGERTFGLADDSYRRLLSGTRATPH